MFHGRSKQPILFFSRHTTLQSPLARCKFSTWQFFRQLATGKIFYYTSRMPWKWSRMTAKKCGQPGKSRFFILNNQHRKMRSISRAKLLNFEEIFRFDLWTLGQQEAISFQMFISFAKPKSNCFNRKTNVKRISFISHFSILGIVYNRARAGTIILNLLYCITSF